MSNGDIKPINFSSLKIQTNQSSNNIVILDNKFANKMPIIETLATTMGGSESLREGREMENEIERGCSFFVKNNKKKI